jgi:hypothetical protein
MMGEFIPHAEHGGFLHPYPEVKVTQPTANQKQFVARKTQNLLSTSLRIQCG